MKNSFDQAIIILDGLNNGKANKQVQDLEKKGQKVDWLLFDDLTSILERRLVPGFELNKNAFVYPALSFYTRNRLMINSIALPLYTMNLKEQKNEFSCSFIVPDYANEGKLADGHWICVHVVKTGNVYNWFVVCSMGCEIIKQ